MSEDNGWLRAASFGSLDGLTTSIALVLGLAFSGMDLSDVTTSGVSAAVAGAVSMGLGEYVSVQTHNEQPDSYEFSPVVAGLASFLCFAVGSFIPLVPLFFGNVTLAICVGLLSLFLAGAAATRYTHRSWWYGGVRQLLFGLIAIAATWAVGLAIV